MVVLVQEGVRGRDFGGQERGEDWIVHCRYFVLIWRNRATDSSVQLACAAQE